MSYTPNKAVHPGAIIVTSLERDGMTQKSLSERTGLSEKHLSQIINGEASITVETSLLLENALGGSASFWINLEKNCQETKARLERTALAEKELKYLSNFPYLELTQLGYVEQTRDRNKRVENLWKFFGVNSLSSIETVEPVAYRKKSKQIVKRDSIAAWLRCGEIETRKQKLSEYNKSSLKEALDSLKCLSTEHPSVFTRKVENTLHEVGVHLVFISHFKDTGISGVVRWIGNNPVVQLSDYYPWFDIFWFNLYHELGHLMLHGKKEKFIEYDDKELSIASEKEKEADNFAANSLIPEEQYHEFLKKFSRKSDIINFANDLKIHPSIVAGRLCHEKRVGWNKVSSLRPRLRFARDSYSS